MLRPPSPETRALFEQAAGRPIGALTPLGANKYCEIFLANGDSVLKRYLAGDPQLARMEADGIRLYARTVADDARYLPMECVAFHEEHRIVGMSFVAGEELGPWLRLAARRTQGTIATDAMRHLGLLLRRWRAETQAPGARLAPFHAEYLRHTAKELRALRGWGGTLFREAPAEAEALLARVEAAAPVPSFAHGDFVPRNVHIDGGAVGVIDFANAQPLSHPCNDAANMWFALHNLLLPGAFRDSLWRAFAEGLGPLGADEATEEFFHEYHRRRWLMLNLRGGNPLRVARALRALRTFARPWRRLGGRLYA